MKSNNHHITLLSIVGFLLILFVFFKSNYIVYFALSLILISFFFPVAAKFISASFILLMNFIGKINMYLFASLFFYLFLFPIGMIFQVTGKKFPTKRNPKVFPDSYFTERNKTYEAKDFKNPW